MKKIIILGIIISIFSSCINDIRDTYDKASRLNEIQWNPNIAVPLIYSTLELEDLLDEAGDLSFLRVEDDGSLTIVYADEYETDKAEDLITLDNQVYSETIPLSSTELNTLNNTGAVTKTFSREYTFSSAGAKEIDRILYKDGSLQLDLVSTLNHDIVCKLGVASAVKNSVPMSATINAPYAISPKPFTTQVDLAGYDADFTSTGQGHSELVLDFEITITKKGVNAVKPTETITLDFALGNQQFKEVVGLLDDIDFSAAGDTLELNFFKNTHGGSFTLADPRVKFIFTNGFGIPLDAKIVNFDGENNSGNRMSLTGIPNPLPIPVLSLADMGQVKKDSFTLNKNTSNLADFVNNKPANVFYNVNVSSGSGNAQRHWVVDDSRLKARIEVAVPLEGTAEGYELENSQPFEIDLEQTEQIESVLIRIYTENGFPVDVATQLYLEDSVSGVVLDSLILGNTLILPSASIDAGGVVTTANPQTTDILIQGSTIDHLKSSNRMRIKATLGTPFNTDGTQPNVKFYESYNVLVQVGVQAEALIKVAIDE